MSRRSLAPLSLALAGLVALAGARAPVGSAAPVASPASVAAATGAGPVLMAAHALLVDVPAVEVNGDALSETAAARAAGHSGHLRHEDPPAPTPAATQGAPTLPRPLAALGQRAHPPTAPPRSARP